MLEIASQMILCLLLVALLGFIIGYLFGKLTCAKDDCNSHTEEKLTHVTQKEQSMQTTSTNISNVSSQTQIQNHTEDLSSANSDKTALLSSSRQSQQEKADTVSQNKTKEDMQKTSSSSTENATLGNKESKDADKLVLKEDNTSDCSNNLKKPELLSEPRSNKADNLTRIKGIGAKLEEVLNQKGIYHFEQIAAWTSENIAWANSTLGFPGRVEREKWVEQAKILASGEETEFSKRVDAGKVASSKKS